DFVRPVLCVWPDMRRFQGRKRMFLSDGTSAAVRIKDCYSEGRLSEPWLHQPRLTVTRTPLKRKQRPGPMAKCYRDCVSRQARLPHSAAFANCEIVSDSRLCPRVPVARLRDPVIWSEERGRDKLNAANMVRSRLFVVADPRSYLCDARAHIR